MCAARQHAAMVYVSPPCGISNKCAPLNCVAQRAEDKKVEPGPKGQRTRQGTPQGTPSGKPSVRHAIHSGQIIKKVCCGPVTFLDLTRNHFGDKMDDRSRPQELLHHPFLQGWSPTDSD